MEYQENVDGHFCATLRNLGVVLDGSSYLLKNLAEVFLSSCKEQMNSL